MKYDKEYKELEDKYIALLEEHLKLSKEFNKYKNAIEEFLSDNAKLSGSIDNTIELIK